MRISVKYLFSVLLICFLGTVHAAGDTLKLSIKQADSLFLKNNLSLMASQFNISAAKALKIQAKLYPNPNIYVEQSLVNKYTRSNYDRDSTKTGNTETIVQVQQLILLAGKRNKAVKIANLNVKLSEIEFENILRTLKLQLHNDITELYYNNLAIKLLREEEVSINELSSSLEDNSLNSYISVNEIVRIKSLLLEINKNIIDYLNRNQTLQSELLLLMNLPSAQGIRPILKQDIENSKLDITTIMDSAKVNNPDLKASVVYSELSRAQYNLSRAQGVPDPYVQFIYDKSGNYIKNYYGLGIGVNLPAFNRNQGNIKFNRFQINQADVQLNQKQLEVTSQLISVFNSFNNYKNLTNKYRAGYETQLMDLMDKVLENYKKRLISLVDFTNYYESYKQSYLSILSIKTELLNSIEQVNFLVGKPILKYE